MTDTCAVCGEQFPDEYGKWDDSAPVYADNFVYHKGCENKVMDTIYTVE